MREREGPSCHNNQGCVHTPAKLPKLSEAWGGQGGPISHGAMGGRVLPPAQARTSTKWYGNLPFFSFRTTFWMFRKPYAAAKRSRTSPFFSRVTSWKSLFL